MNKLYIKCKYIDANMDDNDNNNKQDIGLSNYINNLINSDSNNSSAIVILSIFLILFIYFLGKFLFKNTPEKFIKD